MNKNYYENPHRVMLLLTPVTPVDAALPVLNAADHLAYYREKIQGKLISYGEAMNQKGICIVFEVANADDFENIINRDLSVTSGVFEVAMVVPFFESVI